jgi:PEP-CTERM motif
MQGKQLIHAIGLAAAGLIATAGLARAQVTEADVGVNPTFEQTGPTTVTSTGGFFSSRAFVTSASDFSGGTLTYGGSGSPQTLSYVPADVAWEYSVGDASFPNLQTAFPTGGYEFNLTGGTMGPATVSLNYDGDAYSNTPQLAAASFSALQGLNAAAPITLDFNPMEVSPNATGANAIFFSVTDSFGATVFSDTLSTAATSVTIGGGILSAGQSYTFDLLFDDRINGFDGDVFTEQFYDTHTDGTFSTAAGSVPEPSTWAMMLIGFGGLGLAVARRGRKQGAPAIAS